jgi:hypothetical protein
MRRERREEDMPDTRVDKHPLTASAELPQRPTKDVPSTAPERSTPGPWRVHQTQGGSPRVYGDSEDQYLPVAGYDMRLTQANACLIAAAPDLLEACKAVEAHLSTKFPPYLRGDSPYDKVRAAIAKAEGR